MPEANTPLITKLTEIEARFDELQKQMENPDIAMRFHQADCDGEGAGQNQGTGCEISRL